MVFVGDSITEGTKNGGYGWFEPMMARFCDKKIERFAKGSKTSCFFEENKTNIAQLYGDLYIIAIGCNDTRYRNPKTCAMDEKGFVENIVSLSRSIKQFNPDADIVYISPWESVDFDPFCKVDLQEKRQLYDNYSEALYNYCVENKYLFINPNPYIKNKIKEKGSVYYLRDHIHFNAKEGIALASEAVLASACPLEL